LASAVAPSPASRVAFPPASIQRQASAEVVGAIERAILVGAPRYNAGDHAGCHDVYRQEAERLLAEVALSAPVAARLRDGLARAAARRSATDAAWDMRRAFDDVILPGALDAWEASRAAEGSRAAETSRAVEAPGATASGVVRRTGAASASATAVSAVSAAAASEARVTAGAHTRLAAVTLRED